MLSCKKKCKDYIKKICFGSVSYSEFRWGIFQNLSFGNFHSKQLQLIPIGVTEECKFLISVKCKIMVPSKIIRHLKPNYNNIFLFLVR